MREKVLQFLIDENFWNEDDYAKYWGYCVSLFLSEVVKVSGFDTDYKTKRAFFDQMEETEYYLNFISSDKYRKDKKSYLKRKNYYIHFSKARGIGCYI